MGMAAGRAMGGTKGPLRSFRQAALSKILAAGDSLRLQFPREDLGYMYNRPGAAVIQDQTPAGEPMSSLLAVHSLKGILVRTVAVLSCPLQQALSL